MGNRRVILTAVLLSLAAACASAEYFPWSFGGGLNLVINADNENTVPSGTVPGGFSSAPSPIAGFLEAEYRYPLNPQVYFAPSASLYFMQYLWSDAIGRALPAENENRTAFVPTLMLDMPFLYHFNAGRFDFSFGGGPAILLRYGFLEAGVSEGEINPGETMTAGQQVQAINGYLWGAGRWIYPTLQASARYKLETGWGANFTVRFGIPISNLWSTPSVSFFDSFMFMFALVITPPVRTAEEQAAIDRGETVAAPDAASAPKAKAEEGTGE